MLALSHCQSLTHCIMWETVTGNKIISAARHLSNSVINLNYFCLWAGMEEWVPPQWELNVCVPQMFVHACRYFPTKCHTWHLHRWQWTQTDVSRFPQQLCQVWCFGWDLALYPVPSSYCSKVKGPGGSHHTWNYLCPRGHFPELLLGHPTKSYITDDAEILKFAGLDFLIIILLPLWEMNCTPYLVFFICRWLWLNCTIDPKMDRKPSSLSPVPKVVKASLDLWNYPGYTGTLQSI